MLDTTDASLESSRRRSTFYVPLTSEDTKKNDESEQVHEQKAKTGHDKKANIEKYGICFLAGDNSSDKIYNPDLSACSFEWSLDDSMNNTDLSVSNERDNKLKRYGIVLNASVNIDDDQCHQKYTSTPKNLMKSRSRNNILSLQEKTLLTSPIKEKSKTLSHLSPANTFPPKYSIVLKSTPKISLNYSSDNGNKLSTPSSLSPKKSLSFIRRTHSTKLSRSNSLLKSLTSKCVDQSTENINSLNVMITYLPSEKLERFLKAENNTDLIFRHFFKHREEKDEETAVHSDTSYEKACRRGSVPNTPIIGQQKSESKFTSFFLKRSFRSNPLKRTKSVTKLERSKRGQGGLRGSRSHESLLSNHAVMSTIDLSCIGVVGISPVHSSVLGRRHCFQVRGGPRGERYYSCGSRQERDLWIYSLRKSISPNIENTRRMDNSLKMWIYEAKALPPKKKYFCEINLDKTLYGRTSIKQKSDLLFWGEYFDFTDIPDINIITVNVYRECEKKKKRDKHILIGSVKIPIHEVTSRTFSENWYPIISEKHDSISKNSSKEPIPTLRIKCRFQSIDILPLSVYTEFSEYLKENYKKVCELLEPVIGVKAKEDIGQALVLFFFSQGLAANFLTDVVETDLLRVGDQRLTFRGNSLATKSMEAFLKLTGEQYLQDTLSAPISDIIVSDRDCEVDPSKANGSLSRQQQALRNAVHSSWNSIAESSKFFPQQLKVCFATFRERLQLLGREDMANNLISASIFLRFLCPAILSPSLFNITTELPSSRATRNLTLVAKTLQTLANFTRFQGKENFMEFLNDFLEHEAPRMKAFLHEISTRSEVPVQESVLDWAGYIDQGKQLSILHTLLLENVSKLPINKQRELDPLITILEAITLAKETNNFSTSSQILHPQSHLYTYSNQENQNIPQTTSIQLTERGVIRGVLTPSSLEKNIFRYNDPTILPLLSQNHSTNSLQHSHSTSSILSSSIQHNSITSTNNERQQSGTRMFTSTSQVHNNGTSSLRKESRSPITNSSGFRANTLPRNNLNAVEPEYNTNVIQIGFDSTNAFNRKSPTPLVKTPVLHDEYNSRIVNSSQLSLVSDLGKNPLSLGIPYNEYVTSSTQNIKNNNNPSNMPMSLEDLEDLFNYADEQNHENNYRNNTKEVLVGKGSNVSISNICSSGYQSIATQSQSSSPIELAQNVDYLNKRKFGPNKYEYINQKNTNNKTDSENNNFPLVPYKTPTYSHITSNNQTTNNNKHLNNNYNINNNLDLSSSEERLSNNDDYKKDVDCLNSPDISESFSGLQQGKLHNRLGSGRMPRTNPLIQYKRNEPTTSNNSVANRECSRYQRRPSIESAHTLSDSSETDAKHSHNNHSNDIKRRKNTSKSVEQCEKEIQKLQKSVDTLRQKLEESELKDVESISHHSDSKIRSIIGRLLAMEEELRREQYKMSLVLSHKQRVIEAQGQQIAALDAANNRLLNALSSLRNRYECQSTNPNQSNC